MTTAVRRLGNAASGCVLAIGACLLVVMLWQSALAQADPNQQRRDTLAALYSARWAETICGFRLDDRARTNLTDAISFIEGRLAATPAQKMELDSRAKTLVEQIKDDRKCEPNGAFDRLIRKMIADLPEPVPPKSPSPSPSR